VTRTLFVAERERGWKKFVAQTDRRVRGCGSGFQSLSPPTRLESTPRQATRYSSLVSDMRRGERPLQGRTRVSVSSPPSSLMAEAWRAKNRHRSPRGTPVMSVLDVRVHVRRVERRSMEDMRSRVGLRYRQKSVVVREAGVAEKAGFYFERVFRSSTNPALLST